MYKLKLINQYLFIHSLIFMLLFKITIKKNLDFYIRQHSSITLITSKF